MFIKKIKYIDFNGTEREEEFMFHLSKAEIIKWMTMNGDYTLDKLVLRLTTERNGKRIMEIFEDLIHKSYGMTSLDGRRFVKNEEAWNDFYETEAYSKLFTELVTDGKKAAEFIEGIIPAEMAEDIAAAIESNPDAIPEEAKDYISALSVAK